VRVPFSKKSGAPGPILSPDDRVEMAYLTTTVEM
jgi:hypothetical protein